MMKVNTECTIFGHASIKLIEDKYNAKYVFESCLKDKEGNFINSPVAVFYTEEPHPEGSNYFGIYTDYMGTVYITNAITATEGEYVGMIVGEEVHYSHYRHDYRQVNGKAIDGGRDYTRLVGEDIKTVRFKVDKDQLVILE